MDTITSTEAPARRRRVRRTAPEPIDGTTQSLTPRPPSSLDTLGQRLRTARKSRGWSQEALASPEFTKSYVSAVERGKARPSLKALDILARRLDVPMNDLLQAPSAEPGAPDPATLDAQLTDQLDQAAVALSTQRADEALRGLNAAAEHFAGFLPDLPTRTRYRLHFLAGTAYLRLNEAAAARQELTLARPLAAELGPETAERVRNVLGEAFFAQNMPRLALEQHELCLQAINTGVVQDLNLRLAIYRNLGEDYSALNEVDQAIRTYQDALRLVESSNTLEQQAANYWALSQWQQDAGQVELASRYAAQALTLYEAAQNLVAAAQAPVHLAEILTERGDYAEAEQLLQHAQRLLHATGNDQFASQVAAQYAALELQRDRLAQAEDYATQSVTLAQRASGPQTAPADALARAQSLRVYAQALRLAGQVAERSGRSEQADAHFQQAITLLTEADLPELAGQVEHSYAELLMERGAHEQASLHYRAALLARQQRSRR